MGPCTLTHRGIPLTPHQPHHLLHSHPHLHPDPPRDPPHPPTSPTICFTLTLSFSVTLTALRVLRLSCRRCCRPKGNLVKVQGGLSYR